jgi:hypothetical protein
VTRKNNPFNKYSSLETIISSFARKSKGECVLSVMKEDGSFSRTSGSGHPADQNNKVLKNEIAGYPILGISNK